MNLLRDKKSKQNKFQYNPNMARYMLLKARSASFAYNNEETFGRIERALAEFDEAYPFYRRWTRRFTMEIVLDSTEDGVSHSAR